MSDTPSLPPLWHQLPHAPAPGTALLHRDAVPDGAVLMHSVVTSADAETPASFRLLLLRSGDTVTAFANRCAHFGVPLANSQDKLIFKAHTSITCNVHYARYRWADGMCEQGDCVGESLIAVPLQCDAEGMLRIGSSA
ncbi:Rieske 2Fe-2S domain-containing protein [Rhodoferax sp. GW822-FHT02A01]|uniref:Rieske (2Fe-2S) protein n=1 Tax=Rhodoferax sp. GW822-FHT02A01 TaxID=3141537 RepID=UPI00315CC32F